MVGAAGFKEINLLFLTNLASLIVIVHSQRFTCFLDCFHPLKKSKHYLYAPLHLVQETDMASFSQSDHELSSKPSNQNRSGASISLMARIGRFFPNIEIGQFQTYLNQSNQWPPTRDLVDFPEGKPWYYIQPALARWIYKKSGKSVKRYDGTVLHNLFLFLPYIEMLS